MVIDGRVFVSNEPGLSRWWIKQEEKGYVVRSTGGSRDDWYLTGDKQGRVYLSKEPEEGSYWETHLGGRGISNTTFSIKGCKESPCALVVETQDSTYTDGAGKKYTVKRVRLLGDEKIERGKLFGGFRVMESSP